MKHGFTLIEMMITIAILGVIVGCALPSGVAFVNMPSRLEARLDATSIDTIGLEVLSRDVRQANRAELASDTGTLGLDVLRNQIYYGLDAARFLQRTVHRPDGSTITERLFGEPLDQFEVALSAPPPMAASGRRSHVRVSIHLRGGTGLLAHGFTMVAVTRCETP